MTSKLSTDVFLSSEEGLSSTCTLIKGEREAVLVDVPFLLSDGQRLVADVLDTGRQLTTIFVTHAHPDHWFSLPIFAAVSGGADRGERGGRCTDRSNP